MENDSPQEVQEIEVTPEMELAWAHRDTNELRKELALRERLAFEIVVGPLETSTSGLVAHAQRELTLAGLFDEDSDYGGMLGEAALDLIRLFASQGHSGFSAGMMADIVHRLMQYQTLTENNHETFIDRSEMSGLEPGTFLQCDRDSRYFSNDAGVTWYNVDDKQASSV